MVDAVRAAEKDLASAPVEESALGTVNYGTTRGDKGSVVFRPSIFVIEDIAKGGMLTEKNIRIIRPGYGLAPREWENVLGRRAAADIKRGMPLTRELIAGMA
jgi:N-acetylneuraminate synthase